jgi:NAD(P)-dependent dehydrogenase (short-subunit alcohol dehydrogenase family)
MSKKVYGSSTNAIDIIQKEKTDLKGKVIFITGANTGLGKETARVLSYTGAKIYMAARDQTKMKNAIDDIKKENSAADLVPLELDLGDSKSIISCVEEFCKQEGELNYLINNAGVMATPERKTKDNYEYQIGINHFGHFR